MLHLTEKVVEGEYDVAMSMIGDVVVAVGEDHRRNPGDGHFPLAVRACPRNRRVLWKRERIHDGSFRPVGSGANARTLKRVQC